MSVLVQATARGDVLLRRGITEEWGIRWEHSTDGGRTFEPVSWAGWSGELQLTSITGEVWAARPVSLEAGALCRVVIPHDLLAGAEWAARSQGAWSVTLTHDDGRRERLADGYFYLEA